MPERETMERVKEDRRAGKAASTQAGEFIREEMHHIREGKHGARNAKQAIAIGLSKARRAGVDLPPPRKGTVSEKTRRSASSAYVAGRRRTGEHPSATRSRSTLRVLKRESQAAASPRALSRHAHAVAMSKTGAERRASARKAARTRENL